MKDSKLIERAHRQFKLMCDEERDLRDEAAKDIEFRAGEQWNPAVKAQREADQRPAMTFDKTHVFIQSVANEARQNKPQPKVNPIGGGATTDVANVINGILRHVHYRSHADVAYDTALDYSTGSSFGYVRAITEYSDPTSFDQELRILPVLDPFSVYGVLIPACRGEKCKAAFVVSTMSKEDYEREYGDEDEPQDWDSAEWKNAGDWVTQDKVRVAEYWWVEEKKRTLRQVKNKIKGAAPRPIHTDDPDYNENLEFVLDVEGDPLERDVLQATVHICTLDGRRVLPGTKQIWAGDTIPIQAVLGQQLIVDGEVHLFSLIRFIRDTQRLINIYESAIAEKIALANRVPYLGYKGQFKDPKWEDCNLKNYAYLEAEPLNILGEPAPLPQRNQVEEQITALSNALRQEIDNLKAGMGIFDASLGSRGNETSGVGIQSRQQQSNITNFHFADNLSRAEWDFCAMLLPVISKIYDRPGRQVRIVGEDEVHSVIVINEPYVDPETGKKHSYMLDVGAYDVVITTGPSYTTARAEGADTLQEFFKAAPGSVPLLGDLWVGSLDYPWSREAARRLKLAAPQNIVEDQSDGGPAIPPIAQQQIQQSGQMIQQLSATVHKLQDAIDNTKYECESRERIAQMQEETKRTLGIAALDSKEGISLLMAEVGSIKHRLDLTQQQIIQQNDQAHQAALATQGQQADAAQQTDAQGHDAAMQTDAQQAASEAQASDQDHDTNQQNSAQEATAQQQAAAQAALPKGNAK